MEFIRDAASWSKHIYGGCRLGDARRAKRLVSIAASMAEQAGSSLPTIFARDPVGQEASYRFIENGHVAASAIEEGSSRRSLKDAEKYPAVLAIQDTTTVTYSHALREDLGNTWRSPRQMRSGTKANRNTIKDHLRKLLDTGRLVKRGRGRGTWYERA